MQDSAEFIAAHEAAKIPRARREGIDVMHAVIAHALAETATALALAPTEVGPAVCGAEVNLEREDLQRELVRASEHLRNARNALEAIRNRAARAQQAKARAAA